MNLGCGRCKTLEEDIIAIHERANRAEAALRAVREIEERCREIYKGQRCVLPWSPSDTHVHRFEPTRSIEPCTEIRTRLDMEHAKAEIFGEAADRFAAAAASVVASLAANMPVPRLIEIGDVVQIDPELPRSFFAGCFMLVEKVESWGVQGFIAIPGERGTNPSRAYFRVKFENLKRIGRAAWIAEEETGG